MKNIFKTPIPRLLRLETPERDGTPRLRRIYNNTKSGTLKRRFSTNYRSRKLPPSDALPIHQNYLGYPVDFMGSTCHEHTPLQNSPGAIFSRSFDVARNSNLPLDFQYFVKEVWWMHWHRGRLMIQISCH